MKNIKRKQSLKFLFKTEFLKPFTICCIFGVFFLLFLFHYYIYKYPGIYEETPNNILASIKCIVADIVLLTGLLFIIYFLCGSIIILCTFLTFCIRLLYLPLSKEEMHKKDIFVIEDYLNYLIKLNTFEVFHIEPLSTFFFYNENCKTLIFDSIIENFSEEEIKNIDEEVTPKYTKLFQNLFRHYYINEFLDYYNEKTRNK